VLTFPPGVLATNFVVPILDDTIFEGNETVQLSLSQPSPGVLVTPPGAAVLTILENDQFTLGAAVDAPQLKWLTGGNAGWYPQTNNTHDGADAAQSGLLLNNQQSWLQTTVTGPATFSFWWKISSEQCCDIVTFTLDGVYQADIRGEVTWQQRSLSIPSGSHTLRWTYAKDGSVAGGLDAAFVDQVSYVPILGLLDHFAWSMIAATQQVNSPFPVSLTAQDGFGNSISSFAGPVTLSGIVPGGAITDAILGPRLSSNSNTLSGTYTFGYSFTPNADLLVTHVRHYFGTKVSIWSDAGTLLASQNVTSTPGAWTETPLASPLTLVAGQSYRVSILFGNQTYYWRTDGSNTFNYGTINQSYEAPGDGFPTSSDSVRWWLIDLRYTTGAYTNPPISPAIANLVGGVWTGNMTVLSPGEGIRLMAADAANHVGMSTQFAVSAFASVSTNFVNPLFHPIVGATAQPYPSTILVSNVGDWARKVTVTLSNLALTFPSDLDILLVGPHGQMAMLMSDAIGGSAYGFTNVTLTFDDDASVALPESGPLNSGVYRPTDFDRHDLLPAPAPLGPYGTNLSVFALTDANGLWSLYIVDDYPPSDNGALANGWSLRFEVSVPTLAISLQGTNTVISWPATFSGQLQSAGSLSAPIAWTTLSPQPPVTLVNGRNTVTLPGGGLARFYRLRPQ